MIIPYENGNNDSLTNAGERNVYYALSNLPDDFIVFHSVWWSSTQSKRTGESDFLIFHKDYGFLTIEVKSGGLERDSLGNWFQIGDGGKKTRLARSPMSQSRSCMFYFQDLVEEMNFEFDTPHYKVCPIVWLPSIENFSKTDLPLEYTYDNTLTHIDLQNPEQAILRMFKSNNVYLEAGETPATNLQVQKIINKICPVFHCIPSLTDKMHEEDYLFNALTTEQNKLLEYIEEQSIAAIHGASGTGKTMIALERARQTPSDEKILFLCYNEMLRDFLRNKYADSLPNVTFTNLHELRTTTLNLPSDDYDDSAGTKTTDFLNHYFDYNLDFDHIIIDEGQDFNATHLDLLLNIAKMQSGYFYIFYDKNQLVNQIGNEAVRTRNWFNDIDCRLVLHRNCRNTYAIATTAYAAVGASIEAPTLSSFGETPVMTNCEKTSSLAAVEAKIDFYLEQGIMQSQITIITAKTYAKSAIPADATTIGKYKIRRELDGKGILFTTSRKFKGLETDIAIVIDVDSDIIRDQNAKSVFYVAASRAKHSLSIISNFTDDEMLEFARSLGEEKEAKHAKTVLASALSVKIESF